jgi:hypothetical protein
MSKDETADDGWIIGLSEDSRTNRLGLHARRRTDPRGLNAIRINWRASGDAREIAARLHELANAMEMEARDADDWTFEDPGTCSRCGEPFDLVRPGKSQPTCECWETIDGQ